MRAELIDNLAEEIAVGVFLAPTPDEKMAVREALLRAKAVQELMKSREAKQGPARREPGQPH